MKVSWRRIRLKIYRRNLRASKAFLTLKKMKVNLSFPKADVPKHLLQVLLQETSTKV